MNKAFSVSMCVYGKDNPAWFETAVESILNELEYRCLDEGIVPAKHKFIGECKRDMPVLTAEGIYRRLLRLDLPDYELARLERIKGKARPGYYFWVLFVIIILVNMLDEVSSSIGGTVTTNIIEDFFVRNPFLGRFYTLEEGIGTVKLINAIFRSQKEDRKVWL